MFESSYMFKVSTRVQTKVFNFWGDVCGGMGLMVRSQWQEPMIISALKSNPLLLRDLCIVFFPIPLLVSIVLILFYAIISEV